VRQEEVAKRRGDGHVLAGHEQVLVDREVVEQLDRLEGPGQAEARAPVGAQAPDVAAPEHDPPGGGPGVAGQGVDHRGLARAVGADQPVDGTLRDLQVDVGDGHDPAVGDAQAGDVQQGLPCGRCGHHPPYFHIMKVIFTYATGRKSGCPPFGGHELATPRGGAAFCFG
jgi:hypothetical protein